MTFLSVYETKFCSTFCWLHCENQLKWQYNFFGRIFVTPLLVDVFNFIEYAKTQLLTSYCIMSVHEIAYFVTYNNVKQLKLHFDLCMLINIHGWVLIVNTLTTFQIYKAFWKIILQDDVIYWLYYFHNKYNWISRQVRQL